MLIKSRVACFLRAFSVHSKDLISRCSRRLDNIIKTKIKAIIIIRAATRIKAIKGINSSTTDLELRRSSTLLMRMKMRILSGTTLTLRSRQATSSGARSLKK